MKTLNPVVAASAIFVMAVAIFGSLIFSGCQTSEVAPGHSPFVVEAEKDLRTAFNVVDSFLAWENLNRATVGKDVTYVADQLRLNFPENYSLAQTALRTYKANRTLDVASVTIWLEVINKAMLSAVKAMPQIEAEKAYRKK